MIAENTLDRIIRQLRQLFSADSSGHDFSHTERVYRTAMAIAAHYPCRGDVVALAALLHDADDPKLFATENYANARRIMAEVGICGDTAEEVIGIIGKISFKGTGTEIPPSLEGKIVQDADRLDAIGAIGVARAFAFGGSHHRPLYDPNCPPDLNMDEAAYRGSRGSTINHFYEKLLRLAPLMNTDEARRLARERTQFMEAFLAEFMDEWNGVK